MGHRNLIHPSSRADGARAEELLGKPSLQPAGNEVLSELVALGQIKQETNPFQNAQKLEIPRKITSETSTHFQNTTPKFPRLQLIGDIVSGSSSSSICTQQHLHTAAPHSSCGSSQGSRAAWMLRTPWEGCPEPQLHSRECRSSGSPTSAKPLSASTHGNHCGVQAPRTSLLPALQPLEVVAQGHQLEFRAPVPWAENSKAELPGLSCSRNQARTPQMG